MRRALPFLAIGLVALPATAQAQILPSVQAGVTGGTLGFGPEAGVKLGTFGLRANATVFSISPSVSSNGVDYDGKLKLKSYGGMVDVYPLPLIGLRLSAGARVNKNRILIDASPNGTVDIGGSSFDASNVGTLTGEITTKDLAPTLTAGYQGGRGISFGFDAGIMFQGKPKVSTLSASGALSGDPAFEAALANERAQVESDIEKYDIYPIIQVSVGFKL